MAIHGKFKNETRWISHEEFDKLKNTDPYVAFCFSFGTDLKQYAYGEETENYKKALHYLIVFQDTTLINKIYPDVDFSFIEKVEHINERRLKLQQFMKRNCDVFQNNSSLNRLETLERFQSFLNLSSCKNIKQLNLSNKSYDEIEIKPNSVIYVDPPYKNVSGYKMSENFNHEMFYNWCEKQSELCFISEYSMPKDRFTCIAEIEHRSIICANENQSVIERVFLPNHQAKDYTIPSLFDMI